MEKDEIKLKQKESLLKETLHEALGEMSDSRINSLAVVDVKIKKGKYDAYIYLDPTGMDKSEQKASLGALRKASGAIKRNVSLATEWYKCPDLHFKFDELLDRAKRLDEIFDKISQEKQAKKQQ